MHHAALGSWQWSHPLPGPVMALVIVLGLALALVNFLPQISMRLSVRIWTFLLRLAMLALLLLVANGLEWHVDLELNKKQSWSVLVDDSASMATKEIEQATHQRILAEFRTAVKKHQPKLAVRTGIMALDGSVELIGA